MESEAPRSTSPSSRHTVQVIQQTLSHPPSSAAQYLQQMYAAQQQHLMLHTAALQQQQQQLNSTQLQSLSAQQASLAVSRASPAVNVSQPVPTQVTTINLSGSPQIIQRPTTVSSTANPTSGIAQQAVLLGNAASPALSANQAQMYLRAQMLIFTPTATVSSIQSDVSSAAPSSRPPAISTQVQSLAARGSSGEAAAQTQLPAVTMKPSAGVLSLHPAPPTAHSKPARSVCSNATDSQRGETPAKDSQRTVPTAHAITTPAYSPRLAQELKPIVHRFVIQSQPRVQGRPVQPLPHQPQVSQGLSSPPVTSQALLEPPECERRRAGPAPPEPQHSSGPCAQDGATHCTLLPPGSAVILQIPSAPAADLPRKRCDPAKTRGPPAGQMRATTPLSPATGQQAATPHDCSPPGQCSTESPPPLDMTSGNGSSPLPAATTGSAPQNGETKPPQAVVRPQILTHVIEGFVIQEGAQPFPSHRSRAAQEAGRSSPLLAGAQEKRQQEVQSEKLPQDNTAAAATDSELEEPAVPESKADSDPPKLKCELCGRVDFEYKFKRSKRFCSMACAKRYNVGCTKRVGLFQPERGKLQKPGGAVPTRRRSRKGSLGSLVTDSIKQVPPSAPPPACSVLKHPNSREDSSRCSDNSSYEEPPSPASASSFLSRQRHRIQRELDVMDLHPRDTLHLNHNFLPSDPTKWHVEDVYEFIRSLPGCQEISEEFRAQEIDGQALLLLKEDHLMGAMNIKLGPALKIFARISMLKDS